MWKAKLKNGSEVSELSGEKWTNIEHDVSELAIFTPQNTVIFLPKNMDKYIQFKTASAEVGKKNVMIESRTIGFVLGNNIIRVRVNEKTGNINLEVENT